MCCSRPEAAALGKTNSSCGGDETDGTIKKNKLFFFKQKTAYEIMPSLVGSEMCIRDSLMGPIWGVKCCFSIPPIKTDEKKIFNSFSHHVIK